MKIEELEAARGRRITRRRSALLLMLIGIATLFAGGLKPAFAQTLSGTWDAAATHDGLEWRLTLAINQTKTATVDFNDLGYYGIPFDVTKTKGGARLERKQPSGPPIVLDVALEENHLAGSFTAFGVTTPFIATRASHDLPVLTEEPTSFENGPVKLSGTILRRPESGTRPGIVVAHGSGAVDRNFAAYRSDAILYARLGFVVLFYDKRGTGSSTGDFTTASLEDLADDGLAGVRALQATSGVDPAVVGMSGVSQGGWVCPLAATRSPSVAFIIVISPSAVDPMEQSIFSVENTLRSAGYSEEIVHRATDLRRRMYEKVRSGVADQDLPRALEAAHSEPWFAKSSLPYPLPDAVPDGERRFLTFDPMPVWSKIRVPVLALWGGKDVQVPSRESKASIEAALSKARHPDHTLILFPEADHNLRLVNEGGSAALPRAAHGARTLIAEWARERVKLSASWSP